MNTPYYCSETIELSKFNDIVSQSHAIQFEKQVWKKLEESYNFLKNFSAEKLIYGINTGFGPMAQYKIDEEDQIQLQLNLIRSHASGMGHTLTFLQCKAAFLARVFALVQGKSGIHPSLIETMVTMWNEGAVPVIYQHGGVGASGDLVQLAHIALGIIGEGSFYLKGEIKSAEEVFKYLGIEPFEVRIREGLALLNGTSCMTGLAALNVKQAEYLVEWGALTGVWINELMEAYDDHFSLPLNEVKKHVGQQKVAEKMRNIATTSQRLKKRADTLYNQKITTKYIEEKVQEYYSLRCIPQIVGPIFDTLEYTKAIVEQEINSVSDNPIVDVKNEMIYHGGNFHGDYISLEMDKLKIVMTKLSMLWDRQGNYLLNPNLNRHFPPFLNDGKLGLEFGLQGMQYPMVSNVAENQTLSNPMYVHSIPNNNDNQDIVSMGSNAALLTQHVLQNNFEVLSIYLLILLQASKLKGDAHLFSKPVQNAIEQLQAYLPVTTPPEAGYQKAQNLAKVLKELYIQPWES